MCLITQFLGGFPAALIPGQVENLRSTLNTNKPSLFLNWDKPKNVQKIEDMSMYTIRFKPSGSVGDYCNMTVKASTTSVHLKRRHGLKPLMKYDFQVRAQNDHHEGQWKRVSEYIGKCMYTCTHSLPTTLCCCM